MGICILNVENRYVDDVDVLFLAMRERPARIIVQSKGVEKVALLQSIEREDGSGESFNVTVFMDGETQTFHIRDYRPERKYGLGLRNKRNHE